MREALAENLRALGLNCNGYSTRQMATPFAEVMIDAQDPQTQRQNAFVLTGRIRVTLGDFETVEAQRRLDDFLAGGHLSLYRMAQEDRTLKGTVSSFRVTTSENLEEDIRDGAEVLQWQFEFVAVLNEEDPLNEPPTATP